jgi:hypothetical protein
MISSSKGGDEVPKNVKRGTESARKKAHYDMLESERNGEQVERDFRRPAYTARRATPKIQSIIDIRIIMQAVDSLSEEEREWLHDTAGRYGHNGG